MRDQNSPSNINPMEFLHRVEPARVAAALSREQPRIAAVVLSRLDRIHSAKVLADFPVPLQREVVQLMRTARSVSMELVEEVARKLRESLGSPPTPRMPASRPVQQRSAPGPLPVPATAGTETITYGGPEVAAAILRYAPAATRKLIQEAEPALWSRLRRRMYTFGDFLRTPVRSLQVLFSETETHPLALALKVAPPVLQQRILGAMSDRRAGLVQDEMERLQRVRLSDIEEAQQTILDLALAMQKQGRLVIDEDEALA